MTRRRALSPLIAICGRPNVGKSTLFNRLSGKQRSIVHFEEGITRDRCYAKAEWHGREFRIVDTGGIVENPTDTVVQKMQEQVRAALNEAVAIVFVVDGQQAITRIDEELRLELFRYGKPVILAVNKIDNDKLTLNTYEFHALGMGDPVPISSGHGRGIDLLLDAIIEVLPPAPEATDETPESDIVDDEIENEERVATEEEPVSEEDAITRVAIVGKPNVGKSSFINAVLNQDRVIVDDRPGTTRDAIDIEFSWKGKSYLLIDTAGMRRKAGIHEPVEQFSVSRSLRAVRRADVCLLMMEAPEGITEQDKRIVRYIEEQGTALVLVWTKWDLIEDKKRRLKELEDEIDLKAPFLHHVPSLTISNVSRQRIFTTFEYVDQVAAEAKKRIPTATLNQLMADIRQTGVTSTHNGKHAKIRYATQTGIRPATFVLFVNQKERFHFSYLRFVENQIRAKYGFLGVPIRLELREGNDKE